MELDWSEQSPHIRSLYRPWQPGDGYDEAILQAAEARLGMRLPPQLRIFYLTWGRRFLSTLLPELLLEPHELLVKGETLIFCVENQSVFSWGVRHEALAEDDPSVMVSWAWPDLNWTPSHAHLSALLDDLTYLYAFSGGALHGGWTEPDLPDLHAHQIAWLEGYWRKATVSPIAFHTLPDLIVDPCPTLYVRDGQAFWWKSGAVSPRVRPRSLRRLANASRSPGTSGGE